MKIFSRKFYRDMFNRINDYFKSGIYEQHFFRILFFNKKYYATYKFAAISNKKHATSWYLNNLIFPLCIILSPLVLTWAHNEYHTVAYNKNIFEIIIGGSVTLLGFNVLKTSSTSIAEKMSLDKIPTNHISNIDSVIGELEAMKKQLEIRVMILAWAAALLYFIQAGQFVNMSRSTSYWFLLLVILVMVVSVFHARFFSLIKSDLLNNEGVDLLFSGLLTQSEDFNKMKNQIKKQGGIL